MSVSAAVHPPTTDAITLRPAQDSDFWAMAHLFGALHAFNFWYADSGDDLQMWGYETKMRELAWDPTSRYLASGGGRDAVVWDVRAGKHGPEGSTPVMLALHEAFLSALAYQHRATKDAPALLASAGQDGRVALWSPTRRRKPLAQFGFNTPISQLAWSPDDRTLAIGGADGTVAICDLR